MSRPSRAQRGLSPLRKPTPIGREGLMEMLKGYPNILTALSTHDYTGGSVFAFSSIMRMPRGEARRYIKAMCIYDSGCGYVNYWSITGRVANVERILKKKHGTSIMDAFEKEKTAGQWDAEWRPVRSNIGTIFSSVYARAMRRAENEDYPPGGW